jgi:ACS family pantothenate transporter-like MFS transporter
MVRIPCLTLPTNYTDFFPQPLVTPGHRAAAVVAGLNVIVFTTIAILAHKERKQKKKNGELQPAYVSSISTTPTIEDGSEKKLPLTDVEDVTPAPVR